MALETGGSYLIPMNSDHLIELLRANIEPPEWAAGYERVEMVHFGFVKSCGDFAAFDIAELRTNAKTAMPKTGGLSCPKCGIRVFVVPVYCPSCGILLLTPAHVARPLIHLHPVEDFEPVAEFEECAGCKVIVKREDEEGMSKCVECGALFCRQCDEFIHNSLHQCPVCLSVPM